MDRYRDREAAGKILAGALKAYAKKPSVLVFGLPRGGVPVAYEIAKALGAPLDIMVARKLGVPDHEELAMGAIASGGVTILNESIIRELRISPEAIRRVAQEEKIELDRRLKTYRGNRSFPELKNHTIIIVDDGIATGATIRAVIKAAKALSPAKIIVAVPVAEKSVCDRIKKEVDELICPLQPLYFNSVGSWYEVFNQTTDEEVIDCLQKANARKSPK